jgi:hypothetical protein
MESNLCWNLQRIRRAQHLRKPVYTANSKVRISWVNLCSCFQELVAIVKIAQRLPESDKRLFSYDETAVPKKHNGLCSQSFPIYPRRLHSIPWSCRRKIGVEFWSGKLWITENGRLMLWNIVKRSRIRLMCAVAAVRRSLFLWVTTIHGSCAHLPMLSQIEICNRSVSRPS